MLTIRQLLINYYQEHSLLLGKYIDSCRLTPNKGSVHKLRVSLKNLKGLVVLLNGLDTQSKGKPELPAKLQELFSVTGNLRDLQVIEAELQVQEKQLNTKFTRIRHFFNEEKKACLEKIVPVLNELQYVAETASIEQYLNQVIEKYPDDKEINEKISQFILNSWKKNLLFLGKQHTEINLHKIRIRNRYLNSILSVVHPDNPALGMLPFDPQDLILFQQLLGKWHDIAVFRGKVQEYSMQVKEVNRQKIKLAFLQSSLALKQHRMKRRISRFSKRFIAARPPGLPGADIFPDKS